MDAIDDSYLDDLWVQNFGIGVNFDGTSGGLRNAINVVLVDGCTTGHRFLANANGQKFFSGRVLTSTTAFDIQSANDTAIFGTVLETYTTGISNSGTNTLASGVRFEGGGGADDGVNNGASGTITIVSPHFSSNTNDITGTASGVTFIQGGRLSLGTAASDRELHVLQALFARFEGTGGTAGIELETSGLTWQVGQIGNTVFKITDATNSVTPVSIEANTPTNSLYLDSTGNIGFGVANPGASLAFNSTAARTVRVDRHSTANTAGNSLTVLAGGAASGATNKVGGTIIVQPGIGTGNSVPALARIQQDALGTASGTADHTRVDRLITGASKVFTNNTNTALVNATIASNTVVAGKITYAVEVFDGTDVQIEEGTVTYHATNKAGTVANNTTVKFGNQQAATAGTLAVTWTITAADPAPRTG